MFFFLYDMFNALHMGKLRILDKVFVYNTNIIRSVLQILWMSGYINGFVVFENFKLMVFLKYIHKTNVIRFLQPISKPGRRVYITAKQCYALCIYDSLYGILSTSKGILTHSISFKIKSGGELLCLIY